MAHPRGQSPLTAAHLFSPSALIEVGEQEKTNAKEPSETAKVLAAQHAKRIRSILKSSSASIEATLMKVNSVDFCSKRNTLPTAGRSRYGRVFFTWQLPPLDKVWIALPPTPQAPKDNPTTRQKLRWKAAVWTRFCQDPKSSLRVGHHPQNGYAEDRDLSLA